MPVCLSSAAHSSLSLAQINVLGVEGCLADGRSHYRAIQDFKPRKLEAESCNVLCNFAEMIMREVQRISEASVQRTMSLNPTPENELLLRSIDACSDGVVLLDVRVARWLVLFSNEGWDAGHRHAPQLVAKAAFIRATHVV